MGTMNATWLSGPVGVVAWLDRPANNYEESELLNIGVELDRKEPGSEDVGDVTDIKGAKGVKGVADVRKDCSEKHVKTDAFKKHLKEEANGSNQTLLPSWSLRLPCYTEKFLERDTRFTPTMCTPSLREQEGTGNRTVIIKRIKEDGESENCESCFRRGAVANEGEGHQKQEAQSVNPSTEPSETNYFGEEGHQKHEAQSVNSPVKSCMWSYNNVL